MTERELAARGQRRARRAGLAVLGAVFALSAVYAAASPSAKAAPLPSPVAPLASLAASGSANGSATPDATASPVQPPTRVVGRSVRGRRIVLETFGSGSRHILYIGGIHGNEFGGPVTKKFAAYLRAHPSVIPSGTQIDVIVYANPDGTARGKRTNAHNVDLNRNFPSRNWNHTRNASGGSPGRRPGSEPETKALIAVLKGGHYLRVVSMHSQGGIIDYDGPGGWTFARRMSKASHVRVHRLGAYHGSMGSYVPEKYRIPIITWELSSRTMTTRVRAGMLAALR